MMFLYEPLCPGQDFFFHFRRLQALMDALKDHSWPYYLDYTAINGYGYFTKAFYPDLILIPFAFIGNFTDAAFAYKLLIFTMTVLCGTFTYYAVNYVYKDKFAASVGALLFTFSSYRLLDIYHRASLAEVISFTFIPIVFLGLYHIIKGDYKKWYILAIGYSLMIFTHLISSVLMFVTMLIFLVIYYKPLLKEPKRIAYLVLAGVVTIVVTSYYIFPMAEQMLSDLFYYQTREIMTRVQGALYPPHWIVWGMFLGFTITEQAFIAGVGLLLTASIALRLFVYEKSDKLRSLDIGVVVGLVFIVACSFFFPWTTFPFSLLDFIQFPWRLLEFSGFLFAIAGGYYFSRLLKTNKRRLVGCGAIAVLIAIMLANDSKMYQNYRCTRDILEEATVRDNYHLGGMEYLPDKVPDMKYIHQRGDSVKAQNDTIVISDFTRAKGLTGFNISINTKDSLELPLIYYKGYAATLNGQEIPVTQSSHGLVQVPVDQSGRVEAWYKGTLIQKLGFYTTILTIFALCAYIFLKNRKKKHLKT
ncbi:hypothetical protein [Dysgonomonas sp. 521]|uniref:hypothetical protein n=1 Tax=Dysgonomonas sp. 521 TaxID=2302932 RepID=UPI002106EF5F|nr:hypothetical protein [Dysgonomonas sp. 521]